ncbi:hypothetical protein NDU88_006400 [Pleurodeles waltl]|uniref:Uncharacterized protein n=1 Tax=Pleurodeles waltl TaxID=8319 RepID=A0AAV7PI77_PLEWA|nr:hypothetical protein NDU88_006400 [Pleurodeles waltl]
MYTKQRPQLFSRGAHGGHSGARRPPSGFGEMVPCGDCHGLRCHRAAHHILRRKYQPDLFRSSLQRTKPSLGAWSGRPFLGTFGED